MVDERAIADFVSALEAALQHTADFWTPITVISIDVDTHIGTTHAVLRFVAAGDSQVYGIRFPIEEYLDTPRADWPTWLHDEVMEVVDAAPGLPPPGDPQRVIWLHRR